MIVSQTPLKPYRISNRRILVKREDLCTQPPAPPFSKMRGVVQHLAKLKSEGTLVVGYAESAISMAGWGLAWACQMLGLHAVIFDPRYSQRHDYLSVLEMHREKWHEFGAEVIPVPAGRTAVLYYSGRKWLKERYPQLSVMLPIGMSFPETVEATKEQYLKTFANREDNVSAVVMCVGSGTIASGVVSAMAERHPKACLYGILTRSGCVPEKLRKMEKMAGFEFAGRGMVRTAGARVQLVDCDYGYTQKENIRVPFPCNPYYDAKAWAWLTQNVSSLPPGDIVFWNIGA